jgi:glycyl-tRNA synthetase beta subunit
LDLYKKTILMNKHIKREVGMNAVNSYKRAANILDKENKSISGRPDAVLFRKI